MFRLSIEREIHNFTFHLIALIPRINYPELITFLFNFRSNSCLLAMMGAASRTGRGGGGHGKPPT